MITPPTDHFALLTRIERVEAQNRLLWIVALLALGFSGMVGALSFKQGMGAVEAAATPDEVSAKTVKGEKVSMRDDQFRERLLMTSDQKGPRLEFVDDTGKTRMRLGIDKDGQPYISLIGVSGKERSKMFLAKEKDAPAYELYDEDGKRRSTYTLDGGKEPFMTHFDIDGKITMILNGTRQGAGFYLTDTQNKPTAVLQGNFKTTALQMFDANNKQRVDLRADKDGASLQLFDAEELLRAELAIESKKGSHIKLDDERGKSFFSKP
jgi:hypothetical protein